MKISSKLVSNLTEDERKECKSLSFRNKGTMAWALDNYYERDRAIRLLDGDLLIGWALIHYTSTPELYVYVRASHRNKGLGKRLVKQALRYEPHLLVWPDTDRGRGLYKHFKDKIKVDKFYEGVL